MITNGAAMRQIQATNRDWYRITNKAESPPEVFIYGEIGWDGITAEDLIRDLADIDADEITVRINSVGGSVFGGVAIYNALRTHQARVTVLVDSMAASIASVIAQAGDERHMVQHSQMMIHEANGIAIGKADEMVEYADILRKQTDNIADIYAERSGQPLSVFKALMKAETWFTAEEAVETGLADDVMIPKRAEAAAAVTVAEPVNTADEVLEEHPPADDDPDPEPETDFSDLFANKPFAQLLTSEV
jgi:ATP-dependent Clp endopeptidase proteolytic subunit ClpP